MKARFLALIAIATALTGCPGTTTIGPTNPGGRDCFRPVPLTQPMPDPQPWTGDLPELTAAHVVWVRSVEDPQVNQWLFTAVDVDNRKIVAAFTVDGRQLDAAIAKVEVRAEIVIHIGIKDIRIWGPSPPPPGPPGKPWRMLQHLNSALGAYHGVLNAPYADLRNEKYRVERQSH